MKRAVLILLVGLALGIAGTAAATVHYWSKSSPGVYTCQGIPSGGTCRSESYTPRYRVTVLKDRIIVSFNNHVIFGCMTRYSSDSCDDFRP